MDIGTGPWILAVMACPLDASRVYAIEDSEVIQLARQFAAGNHCSDKILFFEDISTKVRIPDHVDFVVSDLMESFRYLALIFHQSRMHAVVSFALVERSFPERVR